MALRVVKPPAVAPVSVSEAKLHLDVDDDYHNNYIAALIAAATDVVELHTQRRLVTQTLEWVTGGFFCARMVLPIAPAQSVTSIKYRDEAGDEQTLAPANYVVRADKATAVIVPAEGATFPLTAPVAAEPVVIRFVAGYGDADAVPPTAVHLIKLLIKDFYDPHRGTLVTGESVARLPLFESMIEGLRWEVP